MNVRLQVNSEDLRFIPEGKGASTVCTNQRARVHGHMRDAWGDNMSKVLLCRQVNPIHTGFAAVVGGANANCEHGV